MAARLRPRHCAGHLVRLGAGMQAAPNAGKMGHGTEGGELSVSAWTSQQLHSQVLHICLHRLTTRAAGRDGEAEGDNVPSLMLVAAVLVSTYPGCPDTVTSLLVATRTSRSCVTVVSVYPTPPRAASSFSRASTPLSACAHGVNIKD